MEWIMLLLVGLLEITWAVAMKYSEGFTLLLIVGGIVGLKLLGGNEG